jgi:hypothetical protein
MALSPAWPLEESRVGTGRRPWVGHARVRLASNAPAEASESCAPAPAGPHHAGAARPDHGRRGKGAGGRAGGERREIGALFGDAGPGAWRSYGPSGPQAPSGGSQRGCVGQAWAALREVRMLCRMVAGGAGAICGALGSGVGGGRTGRRGSARLCKRGPSQCAAVLRDERLARHESVSQGPRQQRPALIDTVGGEAVAVGPKDHTDRQSPRSGRQAGPATIADQARREQSAATRHRAAPLRAQGPLCTPEAPPGPGG